MHLFNIRSNASLPSMQEVIASIASLDSLDLETATHEEIGDCYKFIKHILTHVIQIPAGEHIYRSRISLDGQYFRSVGEIGLWKGDNSKPNLGIRIGRANMPGTPMFYGSIGNVDLDEATVINYAELLDLDNLPFKDKKVVVTGRWVVTKPILLSAQICHPIYRQSAANSKYYDNFIKYLLTFKEDSLALYKLATYFSERFGKKRNRMYDSDSFYKITAHLTENMVKHGLDGVLYPSVRTQGAGYNIAIDAKCADSSLELEVVLGAEVYKNGKDILRESCLIGYPHQQVIQWKELPYNYKAGNVILNHYK